MIVRRLDELKGTDRAVSDTNWTSHRLLLESDGMGFSFHDTILHPGTATKMICVFNPPLHGPKTHDEHGAYPLLEPSSAGGDRER